MITNHFYCIPVCSTMDVKLLLLSKEIKESIAHHASETYPYECVGVLLGTVDGNLRSVQEARPLENSYVPEWEAELRPNGEAFGQERRYLISPHTMLQLMREERVGGAKMIGFYHSHPDHPASPSETDRDWAAPWYLYMIQSVQNGQPDKLTVWQLNDDGTAFDPVDLIVN